MLLTSVLPHAGGEPVAYLVMEYLDGCTLGDVLAEEKRLPLEWVVDILEQVCSAVHEAHQQGIVHRDLKPENIWLEPNRLGGYRVKVLDFGIAKLAEVEVDGLFAAGARRDSPLESTGAFQTREVAATSLKSAPATSPSAGESAQRNLETQQANLENDTLVYTDNSLKKTSRDFAKPCLAPRQLPEFLSTALQVTPQLCSHAQLKLRTMTITPCCLVKQLSDSLRINKRACGLTRLAARI